MQLKCTKGVYSFETALFYHELVDRVPYKYDIPFPSNYNAFKMMCVWYFKRLSLGKLFIFILYIV